MDTVARINSGNTETRLNTLARIVMKEIQSGDIPEKRENDANNHIHTEYSFSPYTPSAAAYKAYRAGLTSCGIMDHDSVSGAIEFARACRLLGLGYTCGAEMRVKVDGQWGRLNHPDQDNCAYVAIHGISKQYIQKADGMLAVYRSRRNERNRKMVERINERMSPFGIYLDFERDVAAISRTSEGGSITERHLMSALATALEVKFKRGEVLIGFLRSKLGLEVGAKQEALLSDYGNTCFNYDLLGVLKTDTAWFYVDADGEMPTLSETVEFAESIRAIVSYAYLGDIAESVTGDKRAQKFEDDKLDELMSYLKNVGVRAIAYMPTRNTLNQLLHLKGLCTQYGFFEISGEDVNSPRQGFTCAALQRPEFANLIDSTWALIGHERSLDYGGDGLFDGRAVSLRPDLNERVKHYAKIGECYTRMSFPD